MSFKILIVDDSKTYLLFAANALRNAGYRVLQSEDIWVSHVVKEEKPDLILMDVTLGAVKGTNAVSALKKCRFSDASKIYLHSSEKPEKLAELSRECGADGFIPKDGNGQNLVLKVSAALLVNQKIKACSV